MPRLVRFSVVMTILLLVASPQLCRAAESPATTRSAGGAAGTPVQLFNGKDMTGWTFHLKDPALKMEDVWTVKDGVIHCTGKPAGYIRTTQDYTSYKLKLEWRFPSKPGNSGVLLRLQEPDKVWPRSIEAQLQANNAGDIWNIDKFPMTVAPDRTKGRQTRKQHETNEKPLGEWNTYEITLDGTNLELKVNGLVQNTATDVEVMPGKIGLQSEGAEIEIRNIELTPLGDAGATTAPATQPARNAGAERSSTDAASPALADLAIQLFGTLDETQRASAVLPFDSKEKTSEVFTGGKRPGIPIKELRDDQRTLAMQLLTAFTSPYGKAKAEAIMAQETADPGLGHYFLCFFGEPGAGKTYAWRIAEHHLTLVHLEVEKGEPATFGPILLGADPPTLWDDAEDKMIALFAALTPAERAKAAQPGRAASGGRVEPGKGLRVGELSSSGKEAAGAVLANRLDFFSPEIQARVRKIIDSQGGLDAMDIRFFGQAEKRCRDGGRWDFKLTGPSFLCDYENSRGHIHLAMKGRLRE